MTKNIALPEDLVTAVAEMAHGEGKTPEEVIEEATRRYLARERMDRLRHPDLHLRSGCLRLVSRNEQRARELGITEADVPRIVEDWRREQRGH